MARPHDQQSRLAQHLTQCERRFIEDATRRHHGQILGIAQDLGLSERQVYSKLSSHGLRELSHELKAQARAHAWPPLPQHPSSQRS